MYINIHVHHPVCTIYRVAFNPLSLNPTGRVTVTASVIIVTCEPTVVAVGGQLSAGLGQSGGGVRHAGQQQAELVRQQLVTGHRVHAQGGQRFHYRVVAVGQRRVGVVARFVVVVLDVEAGQFRVLDA